MRLSDDGITKLFDLLARKVCFTFAVCFFSIMGAIAAVPAAVLIWVTVPYETPFSFYRDVVLCTTLIIIAAAVHYFLYGLGRLWGKRWELGDLCLLNDHVEGSRMSNDIPTATLREISLLLEKLPGKNFRMAMLLSMPVVIIGTVQNYVFSGKSFDALYFLRGGIIAWITYIIFTYIITELSTSNLRRKTRLILADREAWEGTQHSTTLMIKFIFIIILMVTSMIITHGISTSSVIHSTIKAVIFFSVLNLVVGVFMCILVFVSILITLGEIEATATQLGDEQRARFISGSIDREFVNTATGLYRAAHKIIKYRDDLHNLNLNLEQKVKERTEQIELLSRTDPLTGCFNRGYLIENLPQEIKKAARYKRCFSLIICDLDHFKKVNDTYGHQGGDQVLKEFVQCIRGAFRGDVDWVARYGGEEFVIALPETDVDGARALAERIRQVIARRTIVAGAREIHITVSFGVTGFDAATIPERISVENLIREADRCLYRAKNEGRNRVVICRL
ncbi:MAG: GGDEF domain-containing protein [Desulfobacterota bacterium]|nr:GGDEF domain-containing protein [Thermodesulfobacteriota bacterium]